MGKPSSDIPEEPQPPQDPTERIAWQLGRLTREVRHDSWRDRKMVYFILGVFAIAIVAVGGNLWQLVRNMDDNMTSMATDMDQMRKDMIIMAKVMGTMDTMGKDVHQMTASVATMSRDVGVMNQSVQTMSNDVGLMSQSVGLMSTMTPAVQRMSVDTNSMGRDMHWMMPFNWMPFQ
jgi:uncharacterized protein YoxC